MGLVTGDCCGQAGVTAETVPVNDALDGVTRSSSRGSPSGLAPRRLANRGVGARCLGWTPMSLDRHGLLVDIGGSRQQQGEVVLNAVRDPFRIRNELCESSDPEVESACVTDAVDQQTDTGPDKVRP